MPRGVPRKASAKPKSAPKKGKNGGSAKEVSNQENMAAVAVDSKLLARIGAALADAQTSLARQTRAKRALCALRTQATSGSAKGSKKLANSSQGSQSQSQTTSADLTTVDVQAAVKRAAAFDAAFLLLLSRVLAVGKREPAVERLIQFIANLAVSQDAQIWSVDDHTPQTTYTSTSANDLSQTTASSMKVVHVHLAIVLVRYLLPLTDVKDDAVRFRSMQLLAGIVDKLDADFDLEEDWEAIEFAGLKRLRDTKANIRQFAVHALARLQNPNDVNSPVTREYLRLLSSESSDEVRKAVLSSIGLSKITLEEIVGRTRDVKDDLRRHAYVILGTKVHIKVLSIAQRMQVLRSGLNDRNERVRNACLDMVVNGWLPARDMDAVSLLQKLDVGVGAEEGDDSTATIELLFKSILPLVERKLNNAGVDMAMLGPETAVYWRCMALHVHATARTSSEAYGRLDGLLPAITDFCDVIAAYAYGKVDDDTEDNNQDVAGFVLKQLLMLVSLMDMSDEAGRLSLSNLMPKLLPVVGSDAAVTDDCAQLMLSILSNVVDSSEDLIRCSLEVINTLQHEHVVGEQHELADAELADELADALPQIEAQIQQLEEQRQQHQASGRNREANAVTQAIDQLRGDLFELQHAVAEQTTLSKAGSVGNDRDRALRALIVADTILTTVRGMSMTENIRDLLDSTVLRAYQAFPADDEIRRAVFLCLAMFAVLDSDIAEKYHALLTMAAKVDTSDKVRLVAARSLFDILMVHWQKWFSAESTTKDIAISIVDALRELLLVQHETSNDDNLDHCLVEGFAKLLLAGTPFAGDFDSTVEHRISNDVQIPMRMAQGGGQVNLTHAVRVEVLTQLFARFFADGAALERPHTTQCLSVFFPLFAFGGGDTNRECMRDAFIPSYHSLVRQIAETAEPLSSQQISDDIERLVRYFLHLTDADQVRAHQRQAGKSRMAIDVRPLHGEMSFAMVAEALSAPKTSNCKAIARMLNQANASQRCINASQLGDSLTMLKALCMILEKAEKEFTDQATKKAISSLLKVVKSQENVVAETCNVVADQTYDLSANTDAAIKKDVDALVTSYSRLRASQTKARFRRPKARSTSVPVANDDSSDDETSDSDASFDNRIATPQREALPLRAPSTRVRKTRIARLVDDSDSDSDMGTDSSDPSSPKQKSIRKEPMLDISARPLELAEEGSSEEALSEQESDEQSMSESEAEEIAVNSSINISARSSFGSALSRRSSGRAQTNLSSSDQDTAEEKNAKLLAFFSGVAKKQAGRPQDRATKRARVASAKNLAVEQEQENDYSNSPVKSATKSSIRGAAGKKRHSQNSIGSASTNTSGILQAPSSYLRDIDELLED